MKKLTEKRLAELRASVAHCTSGVELPSEYLKESFALPDAHGTCLNCGKSGTFTWGLVHGEGHCAECGWPARLYHFVKGTDGNETRIVRLLQYHPDGIRLRETA